MPLRSPRKSILNDILHLAPRQRGCLLRLQLMSHATAGNILILLVDLIIQKRHYQTTRCARRATLLSLVAAHGIITVQGALPFLIQPAEDTRDVEGEEALLIQQMGEALRTRSQRHGLAVLVPVQFHGGVEALAQGDAIGREADDREHDVGVRVGLGARGADLEEFRGEARVDAVAGCGACVAGEDAEVGAGDAECRAAVVRVAVSVVSRRWWRNGCV